MQAAALKEIFSAVTTQVAGWLCVFVDHLKANCRVVLTPWHWTRSSVLTALGKWNIAEALPSSEQVSFWAPDCSSVLFTGLF